MMRWKKGWVLTGVFALALLVAGGVGQAEAQVDRDRIRSRIAVLGESRPMLGVSLDLELDRDLDDVGVLVEFVTEEGPAEEAGIREGDVIVSFDGQSLGEPLERHIERRFDDEQSYPGQRLLALAGDLEEDVPVLLEVDRDGELLEFEVTPQVMSRWDSSFPTLRSRSGGTLYLPRGEDGDMSFFVDPEVSTRFRFGGSGNSPSIALNNVAFGWLGMGLDLAEMNPGLASYFGTDEGLLVLEVAEDSQLGLQAGDVILNIDGRRVRDEGHMRRILSSYHEDETFSIGIMREGREMSVEGNLPN